MQQDDTAAVASTQTLDYTLLSTPVTAAEVKEYKKSTALSGQHSGALKVFKAIFLTISVIIAFLTVAGVVLSIKNGLYVAAGIICVLLVGVPIAITASFRMALRKKVRISRFATANNLRVSFGPSSESVQTGMIFDEGHTQVFTTSVYFPDNTEIANFSYVTGSGKNQQTHHWTYLRIKIDRALPHMVFDAKSNNLMGKISNLPDSLSRSQRLMLEGDFNNYFNVYAPEQYAQDALYIFTPDVMAVFVDYATNVDIEVVDQYVYLYVPHELDLSKADTYQWLLGAISGIRSKLQSQSRNYADHRVVGSRVSNLVATEGQRLKKSIGIGTILTILLFAAYAAYTIFNSVNR